jgi:filamin
LAQVECYGPGLEKTGLLTRSPTHFTVDTRQAGQAPLDVSVMDAHYNPVDVKITEKPTGVFNAAYVPEKGLKHTIQVNYGGVATNNSPYRVYVSEPTNPEKVQVFGPGVEPGVKAHAPTHFNVDAREAGPGKICINLDVLST